MKISIDTDVDTFDSALKAVHAAYGQTLPATGSTGSATGSGDEDDDYIPGHWTRPRLLKLVEWLCESDAAVAVRCIAEHAPAVSLDDTFHTGIEGFDVRAMGGRMSAVGFARNAIGADVDPIYDTDYNARKYLMDRKLAAALLAEMDAFDND